MTIDRTLTVSSPPLRGREPQRHSPVATEARLRADEALSPRRRPVQEISLPPRMAAPSAASLPPRLPEAPPERPRSIGPWFQELLREVNLLGQGSSNKGFDLGAFLAERGHPSTLQGVKLSGSTASLKDLRLDGLRFTHCEFDWNHFSGAHLVNCHFENCDFSNTSFMNSVLQGSSFRGCRMQEVMMLNAELRGVDFGDCHISCRSFEDARIIECSFLRTTMPATHFLGASISDSRMENSNLQDAAFFGTESAFDIDTASKNTCQMTRPTTATLVFPEHRGVSVPRVGAKIASVANTIPLRIAMQAPAVPGSDVDREVTRFLEGGPHGTVGSRPLAQQLVLAILDRPGDFPCSSLIVEKARVLAGHVDSVVLPGGEDVSPHLYGGTPAPETDWTGDYRRSLLELGLIHQCVNKGVPLMAICRGLQMTSVYFGATLHQHVGLQAGIRVLDDKGRSGVERGLFGSALDHIRTAVYHHQAVPAGVLTAPLQPALTRTLNVTPDARWEVVMAAGSAAQMAPLIAVQFHPEFFEEQPTQASSGPITNETLDRLARSYVDPETGASGIRNPAHMIASGILAHMSPGNDALWKILADAAQAHRSKARIGPDSLTSGKAALKPLGEPGR